MSNIDSECVTTRSVLNADYEPSPSASGINSNTSATQGNCITLPQPHLRSPTAGYSCRQCGKSFTRSDHLSRHLLSHSDRRLYPCHVCGKTFSRKDLLRRHITLHTTVETDLQPGRFMRRTAKACSQCSMAKVKCHDPKPCRRCLKHGLRCHTAVSTQNNPVTAVTPQSSISSDGLGLTATRPEDVDVESITAGLSLQDDWMTGNDTIGSFYSDCLGLTPTYEPSPGTSSDSLVAFSSNQFISDQFCPEGAHPQDQLLQLEGPSANDFCIGTAQPVAHNATNRAPPNAHNVFRNSLWYSASPGPTSQCGTFSQLLMYDSSMIELLLPPCETRSLNFDEAVRDSLISMLSDGTPKQLWESEAEAEASFLSPSLMNILAHRFLTFHDSKVDSWIHSATFSPGTASTELIGMIIAAGALGTSISSLRDWGCFVHRRLQPVILGKLENGSRPRLQLLQAFLIGLELDVWHGEKRSLRETGGLSGVMQTYIRLELRNSAWPYPTILPNGLEDDGELGAKWSLWTMAESYKRLTTRFCVYDNQRSMTLNIRPSTCLAEYRLPSPHPHDMWLARSAEAWRESYLSFHQPGRTPRVTNLLAGMPTVSIHTGFMDRQHGKKLAFHILGGMIVDHHLLAGGFRSGLDNEDDDSGADESERESSEPPSVSARRRELSAAISNYETALHGEGFLDIGSFLVAYLSMSLAVSVEDVEILFGKEGADESQRMRRQMRFWAGTSRGREAAWCAGQALRFFGLLKKVTSFHVVISYQAGLVLLAFAVLRNRDNMNASSLCLNSATLTTSAAEVQEFAHRGSRTPKLCRLPLDDEYAPVGFEDPREVVDVVADIVLDRTCTCEGLSRRLVDGLLCLLKDLAAAEAHSVGLDG